MEIVKVGGTDKYLDTAMNLTNAALKSYTTKTRS